MIGQLVTELGGALGVLLIALGTRSGLWTALAGAGPLDHRPSWPRRTGVDRALVREWCRAQAAGGYLDYDAGARRVRAPRSRSRRASHGPGGAMVEACAGHVLLARWRVATRTSPRPSRAGEGFGWHRHDDQFWHGTDGLTRVALPDELVAARSSTQLARRTRRARRGRHRARRRLRLRHARRSRMARRLRGPRVLGVDYNDALGDACPACRRCRPGWPTACGSRWRRRPTCRARGYALVTFFDSLHDSVTPSAPWSGPGRARARRRGAARRAARRRTASRRTSTRRGRMFYAVSTTDLHAERGVPVARRDRSAPLGAQAGEALLRATADGGGFHTDPPPDRRPRRSTWCWSCGPDWSMMAP